MSSDAPTILSSQSSLPSHSSGTEKTVVLHNDSSIPREVDEKLINPWDGYEENEMRGKTQSRPVRNLRLQIFTVYRRLFSVAFIANMAVLISYAVRGNSEKVAVVVVANLFIAILMRQDYTINLIFFILSSVPQSWPLSIHSLATRAYHHGGTTKELIHGQEVVAQDNLSSINTNVSSLQVSTAATVAVTYVILALQSFPLHIHRSPTTTYVFERVHTRFAGRTATALVWVQASISVVWDVIKKSGRSLGVAVIHAPAFWLMIILSVSLILPWLRLRRVDVCSAVLSNHACLNQRLDNPIPGSFVCIPSDLLFEWHVFATIPEPNMKGFSLLISKAGDWTTEVIANPPTKKDPLCGHRQWYRSHRIAHRHRLIWMALNTRATFGDHLVDQILSKSPNALLYGYTQTWKAQYGEVDPSRRG
ncbi:hypothetical protein IW262DRAFT_1452034 [Armillaria fumosa]|nr:hypothetical protein IW262DRAFT_1452034 [Armillaria fumosa]